MEQNEPEKKIPSTAAKATRRSANEVDELIHLKAQFAFCLMHGIVSMALNIFAFSVGSWGSRSSQHMNQQATTTSGVETTFITDPATDLDVGIEQERVGLRVDVLHHQLGRGRKNMARTT
jgi:hypothetical protein